MRRTQRRMWRGCVPRRVDARSRARACVRACVLSAIKERGKERYNGDFEYLQNSVARFDPMRRLIACNERRARGDRYRPALQIVFDYRRVSVLKSHRDISVPTPASEFTTTPDAFVTYRRRCSSLLRDSKLRASLSTSRALLSARPIPYFIMDGRKETRNDPRAITSSSIGIRVLAIKFPNDRGSIEAIAAASLRATNVREINSRIRER